ncbi:glycosyl transferase [Aquella oligotrophica]|uniref:Glycosyl transferase n=1 Tax=Aquella oligotrophica TaxID=2067065 RepID=A0A2I7N9R5_9NEIS|nr:glycosyl transferase [Aquella oligotrophica]
MKLEAVEYNDHRRSFWSKQYLDSHKSWGYYYARKLQNCYANLILPESSVLELGCGNGDLLAFVKPLRGVGIDFCPEAIRIAQNSHPNLEFILADAHDFDLKSDQKFDYIILSELVNDLWDVQTVLENIKKYCADHTRIIFNFYSHLWDIPLRVAQYFKVAKPHLLQNWLTVHDMINLLEISGYNWLRNWEEVAMPLELPLITRVTNRYLVKFFPFKSFAMANFMLARPMKQPSIIDPVVSVIVAARNEAGHIDELMSRIPQMGAGTEIIFVEGNSTDNTYQVIEETIRHYPNCKLLKQSGKGKGDAVRAGFNAAGGDILMILDADITVPPEDLPRFYNLMVSGEAEFINGVRLVYPMEDDAMRFLNLIGNKFFSWAFSWLLGQPIRDTLCGTKVLWRRDYIRIADNRSYFGDFDPFGDFDLLFGAARLNLKIKEVPIRYRARRYGETNISRWRHGWLLLKMVVFAAKKIKFI